MAYQFSNQQKANAYVNMEDDSSFKIAGINGQQTNATNFQISILALLDIVGKAETYTGTGRTINQDVEEE